jgi:hypothetical protein
MADGRVCTSVMADARVCTSIMADARVCTSVMANGRVCTSVMAVARVCTSVMADARVCTSVMADARVCTSVMADARVCTSVMADARVEDVHGGHVLGGQPHLLLQRLLAEPLMLLALHAAPSSDQQPLKYISYKRDRVQPISKKDYVTGEDLLPEKDF